MSETSYRDEIYTTAIGSQGIIQGDYSRTMFHLYLAIKCQLLEIRVLSVRNIIYRDGIQLLITGKYSRGLLVFTNKDLFIFRK